MDLHKSAGVSEGVRAHAVSQLSILDTNSPQTHVPLCQAQASWMTECEHDV